MASRWSGRVALVTGASAGIGFAVTKQLAQLGMKVVGCDIAIANVQVNFGVSFTEIGDEARRDVFEGEERERGCCLNLDFHGLMFPVLKVHRPKANHPTQKKKKKKKERKTNRLKYFECYL